MAQEREGRMIYGRRTASEVEKRNAGMASSSPNQSWTVQVQVHSRKGFSLQHPREVSPQLPQNLPCNGKLSTHRTPVPQLANTCDRDSLCPYYESKSAFLNLGQFVHPVSQEHTEIICTPTLHPTYAHLSLKRRLTRSFRTRKEWEGGKEGVTPPA